MKDFSLKKISPENITKLADFLKANGKISFFELSGFMTGMICSPFFVLPSEILVIHDLTDVFNESNELSVEMAEILVSVYDYIHQQLYQDAFNSQELFKKINPNQNETEFNDDLKLWVTQFLGGLLLDNKEINDIQKDELLQDSFSQLTALASKDKDLRDIGINDIEEVRKTCRELLDESIYDIYDFYSDRRLVDFERTMRKNNHEKDKSPQIGRNDPCPCGSGKKYKKCCLQ